MVGMKVRDVEIGNLIGRASKFRIYLGQKDNQRSIVKVSTTFENNDVLRNDAKFFTKLKNFESHLREISKANSAKYNLLFANLVSSFIEPTQQDRQINIFTIPDVDLEDMMPLLKLSSLFEIDTRSSVWIIGRLFKFYTMFELLRVHENDDGCRYPIFSAQDYFISPKYHRLVYYNYSGEMYDVVATNIVKAIAEYILKWTVFSDSDEDTEYYEIIKDLAVNGRETASEAHSDLYNVVQKIWGIKYYPFTYRPHETLTWKTIKEE